MSKKSTRSTKPKADPDAVPQQQVACAAKKVFYISEKLLDAKDAKHDQRLCLEHFYHPGKARPALFITLQEHAIMEVLATAQLAIEQ